MRKLKDAILALIVVLLVPLLPFLFLGMVLALVGVRTHWWMQRRRKATSPPRSGIGTLVRRTGPLGTRFRSDQALRQCWRARAEQSFQYGSGVSI